MCESRFIFTYVYVDVDVCFVECVLIRVGIRYRCVYVRICVCR